MRLRLLLLVGWLALQLPLAGQSGYRFTPYGVAEGLSQNTVNAVYTDQDGFIWFGTQDGLNRFDGERFEVWPFSSVQKPLADNFVVSIDESDKGFLYIGCRNGLSRIHPSRNQQESIALEELYRTSHHRTVEHMSACDSGAYFILASVLYFINDAAQTPKRIEGFQGCSGLARVSRRTVAVMNNRLVDVATNEVLFTAEASTSILAVRTLATGCAVLFADEVRVLNDAFEELNRYGVPHKPVDAIANDDALWLATEAGLLTAKDGRAQPVRVVTGAGAELERDYVRCFTTDHNGGIWLGTNRFGSFRHDTRSRFITSLPGTLLADPIVWAALKVNNQLLVGTTAGLDVFLLGDGWDAPGYAPEHALKHMQRIEGFHVSSMAFVDDTLWVATRGSDLKRFVGNGDHWKSVASTDADLDFGVSLFHLAVGKDGELIASGGNGASVFKNGRFAHRLAWSELSNGSMSDYCHYVLPDTDGLWLSSMTGLHRFTYRDSSFLSNGPGFAISSIRYPYTSALVRQRNGTLLVGSLGDGWMRLSADGQNLERHVDASMGLPNSVIYGLVETEYGVLASSNAGVSCDSNGEIIHLSPQVGLPFDEHSLNSCGTIGGLPWFGGIDGLYFVHPLSIQQKNETPAPIVTEVLVNYAPRVGLASERRVELNPGDNSLVLGVAVPGVFAVRPKLHYRMEGVTNDWVTLRSTNDRISFTTLRGGEYTLEIVAGDYTSASAKKAVYTIVVRPPFYETWFFLLAVALAVMALTFLIVREFARRKLRVEILKRESLERVQKERERISMDLHDNIGSQITHVITSLDNLSYRMEHGGGKSSVDRIEELSDFARGTMNQLRDTIWTLSREEVSLDDFTKRINDLASRLLSDPDAPKFALETHIEHNSILAPETAVHLFRVIQEALNNILKHSKAKHVQVVVNGVKDELMLRISDDGCGFDHAERASAGSYGLRNMAKRVADLGGVFSIDSTPGFGTVIHIQLPLR
jgi:signal transduction histidine kinase/ligand-binding sensor domain-containing protein